MGIHLIARLMNSSLLNTEVLFEVKRWKLQNFGHVLRNEKCRLLSSWKGRSMASVDLVAQEFPRPCFGQPRPRFK